MKILTGEIEPTNRGTVSKPKKIGILRQDQFAFDEMRIIDAVMCGNASLWAALQERDKICQATDFTDEMMERLGELETTIADENGYMAEIDAAAILRGIGVPDAQHTDLMKTLPTDFKFRVLLAQAVFGEPEALLLDEPTNHMDLDAIHWLEEFLHEYEGTLIVISHDRHFLNAVCTHIADIDYDTIIVYPGSYDDMVDHKIEARSTVENENRDKAKKIEQLQQFVSRFGAGQRSSQVQSRKKEMARLAPTELKRSNIERPYIRFEQDKASGREAVIATDLQKSFDGRIILNKLNIEVMRGDKVAIIGPNGIGKTTLLNCLIGGIQADGGTVKWGTGMLPGYYPQDYTDLITPDMTAFEWLSQFDQTGTPQLVRGILGRMLFSGEDGSKITDNLSGGESARLLMAKLMLERNSVLVFDEPTNHLDLESVSALAEGLNVFTGTVIVVSHDRDLISEVATRIFSMTADGIVDFHGSYEEYLTEHPLPEREKKSKW
jgi:ATPase subunit of ABC transporter with duplicated ATPase domains